MCEARGGECQVGHELSARLVALWMAHPQDGGRVPGREGVRIGTELAPLAALARQSEGIAEQGLGRHGAEGDEDLRTHARQFGRQPGTTGFLFGGIRTLVQPRLAALLELEMLDSVGEVQVRGIDARLGEHLVQQVSCRADEWRALQVFLRAWLLADEHHSGIAGTGAEDSLRGVAP